MLFRSDTIIPFEPLWEQYERVIKDNGAIVLTASQPFTSALVMSNTKNFRYQWYWNKTSVTGFANAKKQPLRNVEDILIFYKKLPTYNPQGLIKVDKRVKNGKTVGGESLRTDVESSSGKGTLRTAGSEYIQEFTNYPRQTLKIQNDDGGFHPTQNQYHYSSISSKHIQTKMKPYSITAWVVEQQRLLV